MKRVFERALLLPALLSAGGCGERGSDASQSAVRDSAGVRIVESARPVWAEGAAWTVPEEPAVEIGVADGAAELQLGGIRGAVRLGDGRIVVANGDSHELRWFDAEGRFLHAAGRSGGGPGEFQGIESIHRLPGDSVAVWDGTARRLSVFAASGAFVREAPIRDVGGLVTSMRAVLADGSLVLEPAGSLEAFASMSDGERRDSVVYLRVAAAGTAVDTLARRAGREVVARRQGAVVLQEPVLFGRNAFLAAHGDRIFVGESDDFRVDVLGPAGAVRMSIRRTGAPRPVRREELAKAREEAAERHSRNAARIAALSGGAVPPRQEAELPSRSTFPAFDQLLVDEEGHLWAREFLVSRGEPSRWAVFDPAGRWLGTVAMPAGLDVYAIGPDWILGRVRDELDVEYLRLYPLRKG